MKPHYAFIVGVTTYPLVKYTWMWAGWWTLSLVAIVTLLGVLLWFMHSFAEGMRRR